MPTQGIIQTEFEDGAVVFFNMNDDLRKETEPIGDESAAKFSATLDIDKPV
ncbi:MAG: hypothetical protein AB1442_04665 [Nitrospirota bacterium]